MDVSDFMMRRWCKRSSQIRVNFKCKGNLVVAGSWRLKVAGDVTVSSTGEYEREDKEIVE